MKQGILRLTSYPSWGAMICIVICGLFDVCFAVDIEELLVDSNNEYRRSVIGSKSKYAVIKPDDIRVINIVSEMGVCRLKLDTVFVIQDSALALADMESASKRTIDFALNQCFLDSILIAKRMDRNLFSKNRQILNQKGLLTEDSDVFRQKFLSGEFVFIRTLRKAVCGTDHRNP